MKEKSVVGGQAVIEGVLMRNKNIMAVAVRKANGSIKIKKETLKSVFFNHGLFKKPFMRGISNLIDTLFIGMKALNYSANEALDDEESKANNASKVSQKGMSTWQTVSTIIFSILFSVLLFILVPLWLTRLMTESHGLIFNMIDGVIRIAIFLIYILFISIFADVRRVFQYHGAEHKSVYCYEAGEKLIPKNVRKYSTLHPRCGTTFILLVLVISIVLFSLITHPSFIVKFAARIIFIPLIASVSYEVLHLGGKHFGKKWVKIIISPGLLLQKITTREPSEKQIEVAIAALKAVI